MLCQMILRPCGVAKGFWDFGSRESRPGGDKLLTKNWLFKK